MAIMIKKGQKVETTDDYYTLEGIALRDWDDESGKFLVILEGSDWTPIKIRVDLATSLVVDGVEIIDML